MLAETLALQKVRCLIRAARLQNAIAPEILIQYEEWYKKREKGSEK